MPNNLDNSEIIPSYLNAYKNGKLNEIIDKGFELLKSCQLCPRKCRVNRLNNELGFCGIGLKPKVYNFFPHYGEEPPISGNKGSGTIFFSGCHMRCVYCQNYRFSQEKEGKEVDFKELANFMLKLQNMGCHNINLVTPTHVLPQILFSLKLAIEGGLNIPLVYNSGGYELVDTMEMLADIVDIYLPDMRYGDKKYAILYSSAPEYPHYNQETIKQIYKTVGLPKFDSQGIIKRGLIIRHLVLPNNISGTEEIMRFIAQELDKNIYVSLMSQYLPCYKAKNIPELNRRITPEEYNSAIEIMHHYQIYNGWLQEDYGDDELAGINIKIIEEDNKKNV